MSAVTFFALIVAWIGLPLLSIAILYLIIYMIGGMLGWWDRKNTDARFLSPWLYTKKELDERDVENRKRFIDVLLDGCVDAICRIREWHQRRKKR